MSDTFFLSFLGRYEQSKPCPAWHKSERQNRTEQHHTIATGSSSVLKHSQESSLTSLLGHLDVGRALSSCKRGKGTDERFTSLFGCKCENMAIEELGKVVAVEEAKVGCLLGPSFPCAREKGNTYIRVSHCDTVAATKRKK